MPRGKKVATKEVVKEEKVDDKKKKRTLDEVEIESKTKKTKTFETASPLPKAKVRYKTEVCIN